jgi:hypothetical protein
MNALLTIRKNETELPTNHNLCVIEGLLETFGTSSSENMTIVAA